MQGNGIKVFKQCKLPKPYLKIEFHPGKTIIKILPSYDSELGKLCFQLFQLLFMQIGEYVYILPSSSKPTAAFILPISIASISDLLFCLSQKAASLAGSWKMCVTAKQQRWRGQYR